MSYTAVARVERYVRSGQRRQRMNRDQIRQRRDQMPNRASQGTTFGVGRREIYNYSAAVRSQGVSFFAGNCKTWAKVHRNTYAIPRPDPPKNPYPQYKSHNCFWLQAMEAQM